MNNKVEDMKILVHGRSESTSKIELRAGKHVLTIDEPIALGGTDEGPSPVQVLLLSLAGCLNVTAQHIAKEKGYHLKGFDIRIEGSLNPETFLGISDTSPAGFHEIQVRIEADIDNITQDQLDSFLSETEKRCPVTGTLKDHTPITLTGKVKQN